MVFSISAERSFAVPHRNFPWFSVVICYGWLVLHILRLQVRSPPSEGVQDGTGVIVEFLSIMVLVITELLNITFVNAEADQSFSKAANFAI